MFTVYIIYSKEGNKYYTGYTSQLLEERLGKHQSDHKGFTGKYNDWKVVHSEKLSSKTEAIKLEKKIKKRGAKRYLADNGYRVTPLA